MIGRLQGPPRQAAAWAAQAAGSRIGCVYGLPQGCRGRSNSGAAARRATGHSRASRPPLLARVADTDVAEPTPADDEEPMGGYTPSDYITFSDDERWQCNHAQEVLVDAPADVCFGLWHDWAKLVDFLDLIGQIGLDNDSPNMAMFQCFYRFRRLPLMELVFIVERKAVVEPKSIAFASVYGMPLTGEVRFLEQPDGLTRVQLQLSHPTPNLLLQLGVGPFGIETSLQPIFKENMETFKALAEAAAPPGWQDAKAAVGQRAVREEAEAAAKQRRQRPPPPTLPPRATLSAEEALALVQASVAAEEAAAAEAAGASEAAVAAAEEPGQAAAAATAAAGEEAAGAAAAASGDAPAGRRPRTSRKSASAAPAAAAGDDGGSGGAAAADGEAAAAAAAGGGSGKRGRSRASTSRKTSSSSSTAAPAAGESSSSSSARRKSRGSTSSANGSGQPDGSSGGGGGGSGGRGRRSTRRTASAAGKE